MANLLRTTSIKFYHNWSGFVKNMTKTCWCVFSVHSVDRLVCPVMVVNHRQGRRKHSKAGATSA